MKILDGKATAQTIREEILQEMAETKIARPPGIAFVLVGDDPASKSYIQTKKKRSLELGFQSFDQELPANIAEDQLLYIIRRLNTDPRVDGILVQLPLPPHLNSMKVLQTVDPTKDVDGFHPLNMGKLLLGQDGGFLPCTPYGILELLRRYHISLENKHVVIIGRSNVVGKPLAAMCVQKRPLLNATVTLAHSKTPDLAAMAKTADVLIAAVGHPLLVKAPMVKKGAIVIDVGISRTHGKIVGDVDYDEVAPLTSAITPVPGGVGPMTIAMLLKNTWESRKSHLQKSTAAENR